MDIHVGDVNNYIYVGIVIENQEPNNKMGNVPVVLKLNTIVRTVQPFK